VNRAPHFLPLWAEGGGSRRRSRRGRGPQRARADALDR
jgi:hypothetical protein